MAVDKHVDARMARIELAVQRVQLFIVMLVGIVAASWLLGVAAAMLPEPDWTMLLLSRGAAIAIGLGVAYAVAKLIGYPLQVLARA